MRMCDRTAAALEGSTGSFVYSVQRNSVQNDPACLPCRETRSILRSARARLRRSTSVVLCLPLPACKHFVHRTWYARRVVHTTVLILTRSLPSLSQTDLHDHRPHQELRAPRRRIAHYQPIGRAGEGGLVQGTGKEELRGWWLAWKSGEQRVGAEPFTVPRHCDRGTWPQRPGRGRRIVGLEDGTAGRAAFCCSPDTASSCRLFSFAWTSSLLVARSSPECWCDGRAEALSAAQADG